ncbi:olfactory receptor 2K2-like [Lissotriton helveticus]
METRNQSQPTEFILLGFSFPSQMVLVFFFGFLVIYLVTIIANVLIIVVVKTDSQLHSPMYFFICNLSFLDLCYSSTNIPKCLVGFLSEINHITFVGCVIQMYLGISLVDTQCILLAVMAVDRYVAICNPLNYQRLMTKTTCIVLSVVVWTCGMLLATVQVSFTMRVPFCGYKINHVVCELAAVLRLSCVDTHLVEAVIFVIGVVVLMAPLCCITFTYFHIISTILGIATASGRRKMFSTCSSHLTVVIIFFGTITVMYMRPRSMISTEKEKVISLCYGLVTPALNPLIYTLRNREVKGAVKKLLSRARPCETWTALM